MRILFVDATEGHNPKERTSRPTGGILNSLTLVPEYLAKQGHEVYVNSTYNTLEDINGVHYIQNQTEITKWDVTVFNRDVLPKDFVIYCKERGMKVIWWLHDIAQLTYLKDEAFRYVDHVVALSNYCKTSYSDFYSISPDKFTVIPNGVDSKIFYPGDYASRNPNLYLTASALIKGFTPVSTVFDNLKRVNPDVDFRIYSSQSLHGLKNTDQQAAYLEYMGQHGAHIYSPVSPEVLGHLLRKAWCLLMPNSYPEICSNLLLQAQASGCPVVTSNIGSASEFVVSGKTGLMTTKYAPHDQASWIIEYTNLVLDLQNKDLHKQISEQAAVGVLNWDQVGGKWDELLKTII